MVARLFRGPGGGSGGRARSERESFARVGEDGGDQARWSWRKMRRWREEGGRCGRCRVSPELRGHGRSGEAPAKPTVPRWGGGWLRATGSRDEQCQKKSCEAGAKHSIVR
jgi:hypothetical protein